MSSSHPNAAFVTPPAGQRVSVRELLNDSTLPSVLAPNLAANNNSSSSSRRHWLGHVGSALSRSQRRSTNNENRNDAINERTASIAPTPTHQRRSLLENFRQGSIGPLFLGTENNNNGSNDQERVGSSSSTKAKAQKVRRHHILQMTRRLQQQNSKRYPHAEVLAVLEFWRTVCPSEVTLKMLAFLGPQIILLLQLTQRNIYHLLQHDVSWRVLCEEMYKVRLRQPTLVYDEVFLVLLIVSSFIIYIQWKTGDVEPESWKEHYRVNPCVPIDFSSIGLAMAVAGTGSSIKQYKRYCKMANSTQCPEIQSNVTVWLRADKPHMVLQAITVSTLRRSTQVTIRTMHTTNVHAESVGHEEQECHDEHHGRSQPEECHPDSVSHDDNENDSEEDASLHESATSRSSEDGEEGAEEVEDVRAVQAKRTRALVQSKTRRRNEPIIRVLRGQLVLEEVELEHSCLGVDIWNGNAAIQVQPSYLHASGSILSTIPSAVAVVQQSAVRSLSGRGIVTVDGGQLICEGSYIHNCAATGVYIGGRGSCATLSKCDVWYNGTGNPHFAGGIGRGHSGIYVEQSKQIKLDHCAVAYNTASGISMIGNPLLQLPNHDVPGNESIVNSNIGLCMTHSHVLSNGCSPIDLPHTAFAGGEQLNQQQFPWQSPDCQNRIAVVGVPQAKSVPLLEELKLKKDEAKRAKKMKRETTTRSNQQQQQASLRRNMSWGAAAPWNF